MNNKETKFFGTLCNMFGEDFSKVIYDVYIGFIHDMKLIGIYLSLPFMFCKFFKQSWTNLNNKK